MSTFPTNQLPRFPNSPWQLSAAAMQRIPNDTSKAFQKWELLASNPDRELITQCFMRSKPHNYGIAKIFCIHSPLYLESFERELIKSDEEAKKFPPRKITDQTSQHRDNAIARWKGQTQPYQPIKISHQGQMTTLSSVYVLPLWQGSNPIHCDAICSAGCTYLGQQNPPSSNLNPFGKGIYYTNSAHHAALHSSGLLILAWVSMREPYPIISDYLPPNQSRSIESFEGKGAFQNYNAHFISPPCNSNLQPTCDEIVVFQKTQTLIRFCVELTTDSPSLCIAKPYSLSAAYQACQMGDMDLVKKWIQENPKRLQTQDSNGITLFHVAALADRLALLQYFQQQNPSLFKKILNDTPFQLKLAEQSTPHTLAFFLLHGLPANTANAFKQTLLHVAAQAGEEENVRVLIQKGAFIDAQDLTKKTPLFLAVSKGHRSVVQLLLQKKARVDISSAEGDNALHVAVLHSYTPIVQDLLNDPLSHKLIESRNKEEKTPLHLAICGEPQPDMVSLLLEYKASPHSLDQNHNTPLHVAAEKGHIQSAEILIQNGSDPSIQNKRGELPLELAFLYEQDHIVHLFLKTKQRLQRTERPNNQDIAKYYETSLLQARKLNLIEEQLLYLVKIGDHYLKQRNFVLSALILNAALAFLKTHSKDSTFVKYLLTRLEQIEGLYLENQKITRPPQKNKGLAWNRTCLRRQELHNCRARFQAVFQKNGFTPSILHDLTQCFSDLLHQLISDAQEMMGPSPVEWVCLGLGSMARGEMCPHSDIEFAFVIKKDTPEALDYFRKLSRLLQIQIINLGETKCEVFGSSEPSPTPNGFCMDTGGNVPIGGAFELICTPEQLAQLQSAKWIDSNIILANVTNSFHIVAGDKKLAQEYLKSKQKVLALKESSLFEKQGKKIKNRERLALRLLEGHVLEFSPNLTKEKERVQAFGIKKELYRPFQEILSSLAIFFELSSFNTIKRIEELVKLKVFCPQGAARLKQAISQALSLRLESHFFYKDEVEFLHQIEPDKSQDPDKLYLTQERISVLQEIYKVLIPFHQAAEKFYQKQDKRILYNQEFYNDDPLIRAQALEKALQYKQAHTTYQEAVSLNPNNTNILLHMSKIELEIGNAQQGLERAERALKIAREYNKDQETVVTSLDALATALHDLGKNEEALKYFKEAFEIRKKLKGDHRRALFSNVNHISTLLHALNRNEEALIYIQEALKNHNFQVTNSYHVGFSTMEAAECYNTMGIILMSQGAGVNALNRFKQALQLFQYMHGEKNPFIATCLNNIGTALHLFLEKPQEALEYYKKALQMQQTLYDEKHPAIALTLDNMGLCLDGMADTDQAMPLLQKALKIRKDLYGDCHPDVAKSLTSIGRCLIPSKGGREALPHLQQAFKIQKDFYGEHHPEIAITSSDIASAFLEIGEGDHALEHFNQAEQILKTYYGEKHSLIARHFNFIGAALKKMGQLDQAFKYFNSALLILKANHGEYHPEIATTLKQMGTLLHSCGKVVEALNYYQEELQVEIQLYGNQHPAVARTRINVGATMFGLGKIKEALDYYQTALAIQLVNEENKAELASNLNNIGVALDALKNPSEAIKYHTQALEMKKQVHGEMHHDYALSLNNIGFSWTRLGNTEKGLEFCTQALEIQKILFGHTHARVAESLSNIGGTLAQAGNIKDAFEYEKQALEIRRVLYKEAHPDTARSLNNLGFMLGKLGKPEESLDYYTQSLEMKKECYGTHHLEIASTLNNIGFVLYRLERYQEARSQFQNAIPIWLLSGTHHTGIQNAQEMIAKIDAKK